MSDASGSDGGAFNPSDIDSAPNKLPLGRVPTSDEYNDLWERFNRVTSANDLKKRRIEELETETAELRRTVDSNAILDSLIKPMSNKIFVFMCLYCIFVGALLLVYFRATGHLADSTINIIAGSTAVTVIGLVGTIVAGVFRGARRGKN